MNWPVILIFFLATFFAKNQEARSQDDDELTKPHIVIIGQTGVGKSSLANALIGEDPRCTNCTFPVCHDMDSCTKDTTYAVAPWLGIKENPSFTVVDTPGFGDSDEQMNDLIDEMMEVLNDAVKTTNSMLLLFKATENRFNSDLITMLRQMTALFGNSMWNSTMIGISFFPYDQDSIDKRNEECEAYPETCRNEDFFYREINRQLNEKFDVGFNLPICFIDSWSQTVGHKDDPTEQLHYQEETAKLWNFSISHEEFVFKTIDEILAENEEMKKELANMTIEIQRLNDIISDNITELNIKIDQEIEDRKNSDTGLIDSVTEVNKVIVQEIDDRQANDAAMNMKIEHLDDELDDARNELSTSISHLNESMISIESTLQIEIDSLQIDVNTLYDDIEKIPKLEFPLGTIIAWVSEPDKATKNDSSYFGTIPSGWTKCDGSRITEGPWTGRLTPDFNLRKVFLRGGSDVEELEYEDDTILDHEHIDNMHSHLDAGHAHQYNDKWSTAVRGGPGIDGGDYHWDFPVDTRACANGQAQLTTDYSNIGKIKEGYSKGTETRPKNVKVVWIMRTS